MKCSQTITAKAYKFSSVFQPICDVQKECHAECGAYTHCNGCTNTQEYTKIVLT